MNDILDRIAERIIDQNYDLCDTCPADRCGKEIDHVESYIMGQSKQMRLDSDFRKKIVYLPYSREEKIIVLRIFNCPVHGRVLKIEKERQDHAMV